MASEDPAVVKELFMQRHFCCNGKNTGNLGLNPGI